ncbi:uncharacterized protein LOC129590316 [Paramacrobiotus metropolitanus]|uniref:uncharacterized protein LOC129590316 n=1 Tax=Paramacrobiotus metropolitanus TaxID=2943436 RepID=UPI002445CB67|nr:uncharacterized protein LOC129590316 [Paramacrobiotus metropolitanus]
MQHHRNTESSTTGALNIAGLSDEDYYDLNVLRPDGSIRNPFQVGWKDGPAEIPDCSLRFDNDDLEDGSSDAGYDIRSALNIRSATFPRSRLLERKNQQVARLCRRFWKNKKILEVDLNTSESNALLTQKLADAVKTSAALDSLREQAFDHDPTVEDVLDRHFRNGEENACKMEILRAQLFGHAEEDHSRRKWYATTLQRNPGQIIVDTFGKTDMQEFPKDLYRSLKDHFQFHENGSSSLWQSNDNMLNMAGVPLHRRFGDDRMTSGFLEFRQKVDAFRLLFEKSAHVLRSVEDSQFYDTNRPNFGWNVAKDIWEDHISLVNLCSTALSHLHPKLLPAASAYADRSSGVPQPQLSADMTNVSHKINKNKI